MQISTKGFNVDDSNQFVFVKGFSRLNWTHETLHNHFSKFGTIVSAKVSLEKDHISKGYGYIQFEKQSQAAEAIEQVIPQFLINICR